MTIYPHPLRPGDTIAVTAPSAPVEPRHAARLDFTIEWLRARGYRVVEGECLRGTGHVSASAHERAAEFNAFVRDSSVRAILPPWGGETAIDIVDLIDYDAFGANPTWVIGWSDISTLLLPLTLRTGVATLHGQNLMDAPYELPEATAHFLDIAALAEGASFVQRDPRVRRRGGWDDWEQTPRVTHADLTEPTHWRIISGHDQVQVSGRLIGGCLDVLAHLAGTPYGDVRRFAARARQAGDSSGRNGLADLGSGSTGLQSTADSTGSDSGSSPTIVYLENCEANAYDAARMFHGLRLAGWFNEAQAVLLGRTNGRDRPGFSQTDAALDALGRLNVPIVADVDFGHVPPGNVLINGALADVTVTPNEHQIVQHLLP